MEMNDDQMPVLFSVFDLKAEMYSPPIQFDTEEAFQQYLHVLVNTHSSGHYHLYPEDYIGYKIGYWDDATGSVLHTDKQIVVNLVGLKKPCKYCPQEDVNNESE